MFTLKEKGKGIKEEERKEEEKMRRRLLNGSAISVDMYMRERNFLRTSYAHGVSMVWKHLRK